MNINKIRAFKVSDLSRYNKYFLPLLIIKLFIVATPLSAGFYYYAYPKLVKNNAIVLKERERKAKKQALIDEYNNLLKKEKLKIKNDINYYKKTIEKFKNSYNNGDIYSSFNILNKVPKKQWKWKDDSYYYITKTRKLQVYFSKDFNKRTLALHKQDKNFVNYACGYIKAKIPLKKFKAVILHDKTESHFKHNIAIQYKPYSNLKKLIDFSKKHNIPTKYCN